MSTRCVLGIRLRRTRSWSGSSWLIRGNCALYSNHLPLDGHPELGNNALIACQLGLKPSRPFLVRDGESIGCIATSRFDRGWNNRNALSRALLTIFVRPYARLCAAKSASDQLHNVHIVRDMNRCVFQPPKYPAEHQPGILNPIGVSTASATAIRAVRSNRLLLDFEGTEKIAQVKAGVAMTAECVCPDRKWLRDRDVVHLEPPVPAANAALPSRQAINPAARMPSSETSPATGRRPSSAK